MNKIFNFLVIFLSVTILFLPDFSYANQVNDKKYNVKLQIINTSNQYKEFMVKVAATKEEKELGLMFVTDLPNNYGMLFEFEKEQVIAMWMKNTKISLDMLFIDKNNKIVSIKHNAIPESMDIISSEYKITKVLEINGGLSKTLGIKIGSFIKIN